MVVRESLRCHHIGDSVVTHGGNLFTYCHLIFVVVIVVNRGGKVLEVVGRLPTRCGLPMALSPFKWVQPASRLIHFNNLTSKCEIDLSDGATCG